MRISLLPYRRAEATHGLLIDPSQNLLFLSTYDRGSVRMGSTGRLAVASPGMVVGSASQAVHQGGHFGLQRERRLAVSLDRVADVLCGRACVTLAAISSMHAAAAKTTACHMQAAARFLAKLLASRKVHASLSACPSRQAILGICHVTSDTSRNVGNTLGASTQPCYSLKPIRTHRGAGCRRAPRSGRRSPRCPAAGRR